MQHVRSQQDAARHPGCGGERTHARPMAKAASPVGEGARLRCAHLRESAAGLAGIPGGDSEGVHTPEGKASGRLGVCNTYIDSRWNRRNLGEGFLKQVSSTGVTTEAGGHGKCVRT
jgi:hypothetical protein